MARPAQDPQIRRNEILDAAESLFYERGYNQTMVSDIVKKIGVVQGTFYYYFKSKEEMLEALISRHLSKLNSEIEKIMSDDISLQMKLEALPDVIFNTIQTGQGLVFEYLRQDQYLHLVEKVMRQAKKLIAPCLFRIIEEGNLKRIFNVPDPKTCISFIQAIINCYIEAMYEKESEEVLSRHMTMMKFLIESAVNPPKVT
jgi:AcrR family transcriptional regulator